MDNHWNLSLVKIYTIPNPFGLSKSLVKKSSLWFKLEYSKIGTKFRGSRLKTIQIFNFIYKIIEIIIFYYYLKSEDRD